MARKSVALAGVMIVSSMAAGWWLGSARAQAPKRIVDDLEQGRIQGTRLTSPYIEAAGVRDGDPRVIAFAQRSEGRIASGRTGDPTLRTAVYLRDLGSGSWTGIGEDLRFAPASLMKVAVLFHALHRLEEDPKLAERRFRYPGPERMASPDNLAAEGHPDRMETGAEYTFADLVERMIVHSDNHAKDLLLTGVPPLEIDRLMTELGVPALFDDDGRAVMTPRAYAALFRMLYNSSVFSRHNSEYALGLLSRADYGRGLRAGLPAGIPVASKYGIHFDPLDLDSGQQLHECGIVYLPDTPFVLCVMTRSLLAPADALARVVADLATIAAEEMARPAAGGRPRPGT